VGWVSGRDWTQCLVESIIKQSEGINMGIDMGIDIISLLGTDVLQKEKKKKKIDKKIFLEYS
jgi:hypothetical protein